MNFACRLRLFGRSFQDQAVGTQTLPADNALKDIQEDGIQYRYVVGLYMDVTDHKAMMFRVRPRAFVIPNSLCFRVLSNQDTSSPTHACERYLYHVEPLPKI
jgi:hypothetical protein